MQIHFNLIPVISRLFKSQLKAFPLPVIARPLFSKFVKPLQALIFNNSTNFSNQFWQDFAIWPISTLLAVISRLWKSNFQPTFFVSGNCLSFIFKICQTVAGMNMISQFHEFFNLTFDGILLFGPSLLYFFKHLTHIVILTALLGRIFSPYSLFFLSIIHLERPWKCHEEKCFVCERLQVSDWKIVPFLSEFPFQHICLWDKAIFSR